MIARHSPVGLDMTGNGEGEIRGYQSSGTGMSPQYPPDWVDGAPTLGRSGVCAFCHSRTVEWVHPLDQALVEYREYGKGHTLPGYWALCERCERVYESGDDAAAVELMKVSEAGYWETDEDVAETIRKPLAVFRRTDRGARRLLD